MIVLQIYSLIIDDIFVVKLFNITGTQQDMTLDHDIVLNVGYVKVWSGNYYKN